MDIASQIVKFNGQTAGRDKLCRVFQYSSKFLWWYLERTNQDADLIKKFKILETQLSATRKVLRFGKSVDMLQAASKSITLKDAVLRMTLTMVKLNQAGYLLLDHFVWLGKVGMIETNAKKWARVSARFWLVAILFNLMRNLYDIYCIIHQENLRRCNRERRVQYSNGRKDLGACSAIESPTEVLTRCVQDNQPVVVDTVKNLSDVMLPLSSLGYIDTSPGFQGVAGVLSSIMGVLVVWNPRLKLSPS